MPAISARRNNLDFIRWFLAVLVIFSHSFPISGQGRSEPLGVLTHGQMFFGRLAVGGFFALSGYLIPQSCKNSRGFWHFMWKRACRIIPAFVLCFGLMALLFGYLGAANRGQYFTALYHQPIRGQIYQLVTVGGPRIPAVLPRLPIPGDLNGSLWTIRYEEGCYVLVGVLWVLRLYRNRWSVIVLFAASFLWYAILNRSGDPYQLLAPRLLTWFFAGSVL